MVKTDAEIERLAAAAALNESAIAAMHDVLGVENDAGVERVFRCAVAAGRGNVQHFVGNAGRLAGAYRSAGQARSSVGERFRFDVGIELDGYCSDLGGTAQISAEPSSDEMHVYAALTAGIDHAVEIARPGVQASELYQEVLGAIRKAGLLDYRFSLVGHGIGVEPRDLPIVAPPSRHASPFLDAPFDPQLEAQMVINIECPLNLLAKGAYQHEVTLVITHGGAKLLSARRDYLIAGGIHKK
jgi:Xaa-Pro aminopeptidase